MKVFALGCPSCLQTLGADPTNYPVTIGSTTLPADQVFSRDFLANRTQGSIHGLARMLGATSPEIRDDGSVLVSGRMVVPPGGVNPDALERAILGQVRVPAGIPVSQTPATVIPQLVKQLPATVVPVGIPANWWTAAARVNTTDAALLRLEADLRANVAAVRDDGAVVGGGLNPSTGGTRVYVVLQQPGAVNVAAYRAQGGNIFSQPAPQVLQAVTTAAPAVNTPSQANWLQNLLDSTAKTLATAKSQQFIDSLAPKPPSLVAPALPQPQPGGLLTPGPGLSAAGSPSAPGLGGSLGLGFLLPPPPLAPAAPSAPKPPPLAPVPTPPSLPINLTPPSAPEPLPSAPVSPPLTPMPSVPTGSNILFPPTVPSTLTTAPYTPALPVFPGIPATSATGDGTGPLSGPSFLTALDNAAKPTLPPPAPAGLSQGMKLGLAAGGVVLAVGIAVLVLRRRPSGSRRYAYRPVRRRRYARA